MKTILVLTDSLGLPRVVPERITDDESWVYRLQDAFSSKFKFRTVCTPGMDTRQLLVATHAYHQAIDPDLIVLQVGIVDCYPRALKKEELSIIKRLPRKISLFLHKIVKRHYSYLIKSRRIQYVDVVEFRSNLNALKDVFPRAKFCIVPIAPPCSDYKERNPMIASAVITYNNVLADVFGVEVLRACYREEDGQLFLSDNHHLSSLGHAQVFKSVSHVLYELLDGKG